MCIHIDKYIYLPGALSRYCTTLNRAMVFLLRPQGRCRRRVDRRSNDEGEANVVARKRAFDILPFFTESRDGRKCNQRETGERKIVAHWESRREALRALWIIHHRKNARSPISYRNPVKITSSILQTNVTSGIASPFFNWLEINALISLFLRYKMLHHSERKLNFLIE